MAGKIENKIAGIKKEVAKISKEIIEREKKTAFLIEKEMALEKQLTGVLSKMVELETKNVNSARKIGKESESRLTERLSALQKKQKEYENAKIAINHIREKQKQLKEQLSSVEDRIKAETQELYSIQQAKESKGKKPEKEKPAASEKKQEQILVALKKKMKSMPEKKEQGFGEETEEKEAEEEEIDFGKDLDEAQEHVETDEEKEKEDIYNRMEEEAKEFEEEEEGKKASANEKKNLTKSDSEMAKFSKNGLSFSYPKWQENSEIESEEEGIFLKDKDFYFEIKEVPAAEVTLEEFVDEYVRNVESQPGFEIISKEEENGNALLEYKTLQEGSEFRVKAIFILQNETLYKIAFSAPSENFYQINDLFYKTMNSIKKS